MAIASQPAEPTSSQQTTATTQAPTPSIMYRLFSWFQQNPLRWVFQAMGQLPPPTSAVLPPPTSAELPPPAEQTLTGYLIENDGDAILCTETGPVNLTTNISGTQNRSSNAPVLSMPEGVTHFVRNKGIFLKTGKAESITSTNTI